MTYWIIGGVVVWLACGFVAFRAVFSYYQREWPLFALSQRNEDLRCMIRAILLGPIALVFEVLEGSFKHGLSWPTIEEIRLRAAGEWKEGEG